MIEELLAAQERENNYCRRLAKTVEEQSVKAAQERIVRDASQPASEEQDKNGGLRYELNVELDANDETWDDVVCCTLTDSEIDKHPGLHPDGEYDGFTLWTTKRVYFPVVDVDGWFSQICWAYRNPPPGEQQ